MVTVRLNVLNGGWETVGAGRYRGIVPEGFQATGDDKGPDTCTFSQENQRRRKLPGPVIVHAV